MSYIYKITASEKNTEIRFISLKDYDPNDSYEINGKAIGLLNVDGSKIDIGWAKDIPVSITLNEDKTVGYVNINEINNSFNPENIEFLKIQKDLTIYGKNGFLVLPEEQFYISNINIEEGKYYITI